MVILMAHNFYRLPGGEDVVFRAESEMLERYGHAVIRITAHNDATAQLGRLRTAAAGLWHFKYWREFRRVGCQRQGTICHFHNTFPLLSPSSVAAARSRGLRIIQTLHNYRLICPGGTLRRNGQICEWCVGKAFAWPGVAHACYRDSVWGSGTVALIASLQRVLYQWLQHVEVFITPSEFTRNKLIEAGLPSHKIRVKPHFVYPDPKAALESRGYLIYVGRLSEEKGVRTVLRTWSFLSRKVPLLVVGDGPLRSEVEEAATKNNLIQYVGWQSREDVLTLMKNASGVLVPSLWYETFGLAVIEAFSVGVPVFVSDVGSLAELVDDGRTGLRFPAGDAEGLAARLDWALSRPRRLAEMRVEARREYELKYTEETNYRLLMDIYGSMR